MGQRGPPAARLEIIGFSRLGSFWPKCAPAVSHGARCAARPVSR